MFKYQTLIDNIITNIQTIIKVQKDNSEQEFWENIITHIKLAPNTLNISELDLLIDKQKKLKQKQIEVLHILQILFKLLTHMNPPSSSSHDIFKEDSEEEEDLDTDTLEDSDSNETHIFKIKSDDPFFSPENEFFKQLLRKFKLLPPEDTTL